jgi:hypothetical protein
VGQKLLLCWLVVTQTLNARSSLSMLRRLTRACKLLRLLTRRAAAALSADTERVAIAGTRRVRTSEFLALAGPIYRGRYDRNWNAMLNASINVAPGRAYTGILQCVTSVIFWCSSPHNSARVKAGADFSSSLEGSSCCHWSYFAPSNKTTHSLQGG